jgi:glycine oxidase
VIGAGIIGASIAEELAHRGAEVTMLDMRAPGRGASWASAGLLAPYTEADRDSPLLAMGVRSLAMFDDFVRRAHETSGRAIEYARKGTLEVALEAGDVAHLKATHEWLGESGIKSTWLDPRAVRELEPNVAEDVHGALHIHAHGFVGVQSLVAALIESARREGAELESPIEVADVSSTDHKDELAITTRHRNYVADHIVVAAGSWSSRIRVKGHVPLRVRPVRGQLLRFRWHSEPRPALPVWTSGCYTVPWSDGTLLVGATVEEVGFDESTTAAGIQTLTAAAMRALPETARAALVDARSGLRPASADGLPYIGSRPDAPRITYATGHFRNGILLAPLTASMVATAILDGRADTMAKWTQIADRG